MSVLDKYECEGQTSLFDLGTWCGKTLSEPSVPTVEKTSVSSLKKQRGSQTKKPLYLDLRRGRSGHLLEPSWEMGGALLGEYTMHSFGEYPNEERESHLSQILVVGAHPKYYLSAKACQGILRRAEKKGKELPKLLRDTLIRQATPSKLGGGAERDRYGKRAGKGALIQTELSGTLGVSQDQTLITSVGTKNDISEKEITCYGLDRASFNQGTNALYNFSVEEELAQTIVAKGVGGGADPNLISALCARDYKGVGTQYVTDGKLVIQENRTRRAQR